MDPKGSGYPVSGVCIMQLLCRSHCIRNKVTVTTSKSVCSIVTDGIGVLLCSPFIVGFKGCILTVTQDKYNHGHINTITIYHFDEVLLWYSSDDMNFKKLQCKLYSMSKETATKNKGDRRWSCQLSTVQYNRCRNFVGSHQYHAITKPFSSVHNYTVLECLKGT